MQLAAQQRRIRIAATMMLAWLVLCATSAAAADRPNIILLESDDHHYQALGCMGDPVQTPNIDRLAERGVLFRHNVAQGAMCSPSRNALLTGAYPHNTGVYHNQDGVMPKNVWTFPAALERAGYLTALVGKNHFKPYSTTSVRDRTTESAAAELATLGFEHIHAITGKVSAATSKAGPGQDAYRDYLRASGLLDDLERDYAENRAAGRQFYTGASALPEEHYHDVYIASRAIDFIESQRGERPFFMWVDFVAPHPPADAPEPFASMYRAADMRKPLKAAAGKGPPVKGRAVDDETYQKFRAAYYGMITLLDKQVGRIVEALEASGQLDNTVVVFVGDQGSMLGDLGQWGKGLFYKGSINAPLVIAGPKGLVRHSVVHRPVELVDLAPTILELAGASPDDSAHCLGHSLMPLLSGEGNYSRTHAFAETHEVKMVVGDRYKYVRDPSSPLLFDLQSDPDELTNLAGTKPDVEAALDREIDAWLERTSPALPPNARPQRGRAAGAN